MKGLRLAMRILLAGALLAPLQSPPADARLAFVQDASGRRAPGTRDLIQWTHSRLVFDREIERVAVGREQTLEVEVLGGRELLLLAKQVGRTTLVVWYVDGSSESHLFRVSEDLSVLRRALRDIDAGIRLEPAPDRQALILRGTVPSVDYKMAAERVARHYLGVGRPDAGPAEPTAAARGPSAAPGMVMAAPDRRGAPDAAFRLDARGTRDGSRVAVINLLQVEALPPTLEAKLGEAIRAIGGGDVRIRRMVRGDLPDDLEDTLILEGEVRDQVTLTRILNVAARLLPRAVAADGTPPDVAVVADEAGGLLARRGRSRLGAAFPGGLGDSGGALHDNDIRTNVARAKLLSVADGRLLSMIRVRDLPQIRVAVQIHEVSRNRLRRWRPDLSLVTRGYSPDGLFTLGGLSRLQPGQSSIENALQLIGGTLTNNLQIGGSDLAFDLLFSLLERAGISRTLSRPSLMVLAGEVAVFSVGGEVPVPTAFAPTGLRTGDEVGANTPGVFSGTRFKAFGVQLSVRAMVDEDDRITLDVRPTISSPDTLLTRRISESTGADLNTTAFNTRSVRTTTRVRDGQPLILAGLVSSEQSSENAFTPGLNQLPLLGRLAEASDALAQDRELIIIVTPTLVREPRGDAHLWAFPPTLELVDRALLTPPARDRGEER